MKNWTTVLFIGLLCVSSTTFGHEHSDEINQLTVVGQGKTKIIADMSVVRISIEVNEKQVADVQQALADKTQAVLTKIRSFDVAKLETDQMQIHPRYSTGKPRLLLGYQGRMTISFETTALKAGKIIDSSIQAGANRLEGIQLKASDEKIEAARIESLKKASQDALKEANVVLESLNLKLKSVVQVNIQNQGNDQHYPQPRMYYSEMGLGAAQKSSTEITSKEHEINAAVTLKVMYE